MAESSKSQNFTMFKVLVFRVPLVVIFNFKAGKGEVNNSEEIFEFLLATLAYALFRGAHAYALMTHSNDT